MERMMNVRSCFALDVHQDETCGFMGLERGAYKEEFEAEIEKMIRTATPCRGREQRDASLKLTTIENDYRICEWGLM